MKRPKGKGYELVLTDPFFNPIHAALRSNTSKYITLHSEIINLGGTIRLVRGGETLNDYEKRMEGYKKDLMLQREVSVLAKEIS
jgi:hypothetical protein